MALYCTININTAVYLVQRSCLYRSFVTIELVSRMKNQRGQWVCWMSTSRKNGLMRRTHTHGKCCADIRHNRQAHNTTAKEKKGQNTYFEVHKYKKSNHLSWSIFFCSYCENLPACFLQYSWYLVRGTTICTPTCFVDRHNSSYYVWTRTFH